MAKITFIEPSGNEHVVEAEAGMTLMETAVRNMVPGIDADCGGGCSCATCHVFVVEDWRAATGERNALEDATLEFAENVEDNSRLACQIKITPELDGLVVHMPESQR